MREEIFRPFKILALEDPPQAKHVHCLKRILESSEGAPTCLVGEAVLPAQGGEDCTSVCIEAIQRVQPDLIVLCLETESENVQTVLAAVRKVSVDLPVLAMVAGNSPKSVCNLLDFGIEDFLTVPVTAQELLPRLWKWSTKAMRPRQRLSGFKEELGLNEFIGESPALRDVLRMIPAVAKCEASVLIAGETGTGKELCARAIHYLSARSDNTFMPVNCGAIPMELVENELFGHEKEAFTGASSVKPGLFRAAEGGTVLLDEVDALPLAAQVKLLRILQEKQLKPLGSARNYTVNVRIVAACNASLEEAVNAGRFRKDLYYRLNVIPIRMPSLRQRREDIPLLARYFLDKYAKMFEKRVRDFGPGAIQKLVAYEWPGNIRELENIIERAVVLAEGDLLRAQDIHSLATEETTTFKPFKVLKQQAVAQFERTYIQQLLLSCDGNITKASKAACKDRRAFWQLMRKHQLVVPDTTATQAALPTQRNQEPCQPKRFTGLRDF